MQLAVIVLAAGEGTRMHSNLPKVLHPIAGLPLIGHVLSTAFALSAEHVVTVLGHQKDLVAGYVTEHFPSTIVTEQGPTPGTGAAVEAGLAALPEDFKGEVLVLSGDVPLLDVTSISELIEMHRDSSNAATLISTLLDNPNGYGRVLRSKESLIGIVEQKDASESDLLLNEVNAGVYVFDREHLDKSPYKCHHKKCSRRKIFDRRGFNHARAGSICLRASDKRPLVGCRHQRSSAAVSGCR